MFVYFITDCDYPSKNSPGVENNIEIVDIECKYVNDESGDNVTSNDTSAIGKSLSSSKNQANYVVIKNYYINNVIFQYIQ